MEISLQAVWIENTSSTDGGIEYLDEVQWGNNYLNRLKKRL